MTEAELNRRFWANVDALLKKQKKDLRTLAKETGLDYENLRNKKHNNQTIRKSSECLIADCLGVDYCELVKPVNNKYKIIDSSESVTTIVFPKSLSTRQRDKLDGYLACLSEEE